jgi:hypothetical protein
MQPLIERGRRLAPLPTAREIRQQVLDQLPLVADEITPRR